jgi:nucleoside-triphosphatase THEP1
MESKTAFLITGKPRIGKSTMIKKLVHDLGTDVCGGFYTEEIADAGHRVGFKCVSVDGESVEIAHVDNPSDIRVGRYGIDVAMFERFSLGLLKGALSSRIIVIDEIGFMQMLSTPFRDTVHDIISGGHIVLGTVPVDCHPDIDQIKHLQTVEIISLNEFNRDATSQLVANYIRRALGSAVVAGIGGNGPKGLGPQNT